MARRRVDVEIGLLHILAAVALLAREAEHALLQKGVMAVPECERQTQILTLVADAPEPVLAPTIGARAGLLEGEVIPGLAVCAVVLAHGTPGAFGEVRPPSAPVGRPSTLLLQALAFGVGSDGVGHGFAPW